MLLSIDPGTRTSAYVILDAAERPIEHGKLDNEELLKLVEQHPRDAGCWSAITTFALEWPAIAMYVGAETLDTAAAAGVFEYAYAFARRAHALPVDSHRIKRHDVKMFLLGRTNQRSTDAKVRAALIARYGGPSSIKRGEPLHGIANDEWSALAVGVTYLNGKRSNRSSADDEIKAAEILWNTGKEIPF